MTDTSIKHIGAKYDKTLGPVEIARRVRTDLKEAAKAGLLPKGTKVSVRCSRGTGKTITAEIERCPGVTMLNPGYFFGQALNIVLLGRSRYTLEFRLVLQQVEDILNAYLLDRSDTMTDYFNVNFYANVTGGQEQESLERAGLLESVELKDLQIARTAVTAAQLERLVVAYDVGGRALVRVPPPEAR